MKKCKTAHTIHSAVPSPRRHELARAAKSAEARVRGADPSREDRDWERSRFTGTGLNWAPDSRLPAAGFAHNSSALGGEGASASQNPPPQTPLHCARETSGSRRHTAAKPQQGHKPATHHSGSPRQTHHFLLLMHPGVPHREPAVRKPGRNSPPFSYPELKYGGKGATFHYPCSSLESSRE